MGDQNIVQGKIRNVQFHSTTSEILCWRSLQTCKLLENMNVIESYIETIKILDIKCHLMGSRAILDMLMATFEAENNRLQRYSCIGVQQAYDIYLSYSNSANPSQRVSDKNHKKAFKEFLCHPKYGLCIYIYDNQIFLRRDDVDLDVFFKFQLSNVDNPDKKKDLI